jgi:hypothetical protein
MDIQRKFEIDISRNYIFIHIPKCSGNSIKKTFLSNGYKILELQNGPSNFNKCVQKEVSKFVTCNQKNKILICGHISLGEVSKFKKDLKLENFSIFTILREPIERCISVFNYWGGRLENNLSTYNYFSVYDFFNNKSNKICNEFDNRLCYQLSDCFIQSSISSYDPKAYYETDHRIKDKKVVFQNCLSLLQLESVTIYILDEIKETLPKENVSKVIVANAKTIDLKTQNLLRDLNKYDLQLYHFISTAMKSTEI